MKKSLVVSMGFTALTLLVAGCVTTQQARHTTPAAFLGSAAGLLKPGPKGGALLVYIKPGVDWSRYTKVMLDPVTYWLGQGEKDGLSAKQRKLLVDYYHLQLVQQFSKSYTLVDTPEPGTIRLAVALIKAEHSEPALETVSTVYPAALVISAAKEALLGKASFVGEATSNMKATDAESGDLLAAGADERVGGMAWHGKFDRWEAVEDSSAHWAQLCVYRLCTLQGLNACVKPTEK